MPIIDAGSPLQTNKMPCLSRRKPPTMTPSPALSIRFGERLSLKLRLTIPSDRVATNDPRVPPPRQPQGPFPSSVGHSSHYRSPNQWRAPSYEHRPTTSHGKRRETQATSNQNRPKPLMSVETRPPLWPLRTRETNDSLMWVIMRRRRVSSERRRSSCYSFIYFTVNITTGDPLHSRAACTQPCNVNTHSRAHCSPGARLCQQWGTAVSTMGHGRLVPLPAAIPSSDETDQTGFQC